MSFDVSTLSAADLAAVIAHARNAEVAEREARKAARDSSRTFISKFVRILAGGSAGVETTFKSGAVGWSLGGKNVEVALADGTLRKARVQILVRWEDTIPAADDK